MIYIGSLENLYLINKFKDIVVFLVLKGIMIINICVINIVVNPILIKLFTPRNIVLYIINNLTTLVNNYVKPIGPCITI